MCPGNESNGQASRLCSPLGWGARQLCRTRTLRRQANQVCAEFAANQPRVGSVGNCMAEGTPVGSEAGH